MKAHLAVAAALALCSTRMDAQKVCTVDMPQRWAEHQRAWLDESAHSWTNDTLRTALLRAVGDTTSLGALQFGIGWTNSPVRAISDTALVAQLMALARQRGANWPTKSVVGAKGVRAVAALAMRDTSLERVVIHRLMEAGPDESFAPDVAMIEDRMRLRDGRKQLYGTVGANQGPAPATEDLKHVDLRREGALLPPFKLSEACR